MLSVKIHLIDNDDCMTISTHPYHITLSGRNVVKQGIVSYENLHMLSGQQFVSRFDELSSVYRRAFFIIRNEKLVVIYHDEVFTDDEIGRNDHIHRLKEFMSYVKEGCNDFKMIKDLMEF